MLRDPSATTGTSAPVRPDIAALCGYVPGEQPKLTKLVKLNTNENPYGPSPKALEAMRGELTDNLRLYPDPNGEYKPAYMRCKSRFYQGFP